MRFERFKTFSDMLAFAVKTAAAYAPGSLELDVMAYSEESAKRPSILLCPPEGETVSLRWFAYAEAEGIDFYGKRARVEANEAGQAFAKLIRAELDKAAAVDLRRAPFEKLDGIPADICRTVASNEKGHRVNYHAWVYASPSPADKVPAVGETVTCIVNRIGEVKVTGYFREGGYVGIQGDVVAPPEWFVKQNGALREVFIFPSEFRLAPAAAPEPSPAAPAGWTEIEGGAAGTSLEDVDAKAAAAMANPGTPIELFEGCTMLALGSPADVAPAADLLAATFGETFAPPPAAAPAALRHPGKPALTMLQGEAIACLWEAFLEMRDEIPGLHNLIEEAGTVHARHIAISLSAMACDVWENMTEEQREKVIPYDWEFIPAFVKCIDWENDFDHIQVTYVGTKTVFDFIAAICPAN